MKQENEKKQIIEHRVIIETPIYWKGVFITLGLILFVMAVLIYTCEFM